MKRFMLAVSCLSLSACMMADDLHVSGNLSDVGNDTLIAMTYLNNSVDQTMKVVGKDGAFDFHMDVKEPAPLVLQVRHPLKDGQQPMAAYAVLMAVPGENLKVTGSFSNYQVDGSAFYKDFEQCRKVSASFEEGVKNLQRDYSAKMEQGANPDSLEKVINKAYEELKANLSDATLKYIKAHPDMEACVSMLDNVDVENYKEVLAALSPAVREGRMKGLVDHFADYAQKALEREAAKKNTVEGNVAPDFTLKSIDGKNISLSSLKGKVVVLDFWGSWCGWCIKGMPDMKKYYEKYNGKLEILGVDCNDTEEKWKAAVEKHQLPWKHVYNPRSNREVLTKYAVSGFPTKVLVDPKGNIVKLLAGEDPAFYQLLDEVLAK